MGKWERAITSAAATAIVMGLVSLSPVVAQAAVCGGNAHADTHVNEHANTHVNEHVNTHVNEHANTHVNEHANTHVNEHANTHVNEHINTHVNEHVNTQVNEHVNAQVNERVNTHVNEHVNTHVNEHINTQVNEHVNADVNEHVSGQVTQVTVELSQSEQALLTALQSLHCDRIDYLYAYFENVHLTETQITTISTNVNRIAVLCGHSTNLSQLTVTQRQEVWQLFVATFSVCGLHVSAQDVSGHSVNVLNQNPGTAVSLQVKDETGHKLCTVSITNTSSPTSYVKASESLEQASKASTHLNASNLSNTAVTGKLPQTSTHDPLLIAIGLLLAALGAAGLILGFRLSKRS